MKPKNFPGAKNRRRMVARDGLQKQLETAKLDPSMRELKLGQLQVLEERIISQEAAMAMESKKFQPRPRKKGVK